MCEEAQSWADLQSGRIHEVMCSRSEKPKKGLRPMPETPDFLRTTKHTMERFGCSRQSLYRWREAGLIEAVTFQNGVRYRESDIARIINEGLPKEPGTTPTHDAGQGVVS